MCNIWRIPRDTPTLSKNEWLALLSRDLFSDLLELDITGGEPFLRRDLVDLVKAICQLKQTRLKALKSVAITTNGFLTDQVVEGSRQILAQARKEQIDVVMVCALDAVGELHDTIRRYPGGWDSVNRTIQGLKKLKAHFPNLFIGLKTTILPLNVDQLDSISQYAQRHQLFTIISPCIITEGRYLNPDRAESLSFKPRHIEAMIRFFQKTTSQWSFHDRCLVKYLKTGVMRKPCSCGFNYFFIRSQGDLLPCPLLDISPGNITQSPIENILTADEALEIRQRAGKFQKCRDCTEPGLERYSLPCEGWTYLSLLPKMGRIKFLQMHHHMGLDKYFP
jgi:MoaA/NifB/PqqE/SkfB family radical SAM enzyme